MNEISVLISYIIERFRLDSFVNTITMVTDFDFDSQKENIYTLVNINYLESEINPGICIGYFEITVVQQRNIQPIKTDSKIMFDTNMIDNLNETHSVCNKFISFLESQNNEHNIEIISKSRLKVLKERAPNNVDGYKFSIALSIPNKTSSC